jgi:DNA-binding MarR family transcriptional regulator
MVFGMPNISMLHCYGGPDEEPTFEKESRGEKLTGSDGCPSVEKSPPPDERASAETSLGADRGASEGGPLDPNGGVSEEGPRGPNRGASAERFLDAFDDFVQAVRRARGASSHERGHSLTLSQYGLLQPLADFDGARVRELAEQAGIAPSTATRILDALERRGIVERRPSSGDRRGVRITLTSAGRRMFEGEDEWMRAREREFYEHLPADERALAPDLLERLATLIDELAAGPNAPGPLGSEGRRGSSPESRAP